MPRNALPRDELLKVLADAPAQILTYTKDVSDEELHGAPGDAEWSANEVLAHLRSCADVWGGCIERILAEDEPILRASSPRAEVNRKDYPELPWSQSLTAYTRQRAKLLDILRALTPKEWSRQATVTVAGARHIRTVEFYAQWLAEHERPHIKQIKRIGAEMRRRRAR